MSPQQKGSRRGTSPWVNSNPRTPSRGRYMTRNASPWTRSQTPHNASSQSRGRSQGRDHTSGQGPDHTSGERRSRSAWGQARESLRTRSMTPIRQPSIPGSINEKGFTARSTSTPTRQPNVAASAHGHASMSPSQAPGDVSPLTPSPNKPTYAGAGALVTPRIPSIVPPVPKIPDRFLNDESSPQKIKWSAQKPGRCSTLHNSAVKSEPATMIGKHVSPYGAIGEPVPSGRQVQAVFHRSTVPELPIGELSLEDRYTKRREQALESPVRPKNSQNHTPSQIRHRVNIQMSGLQELSVKTDLLEHVVGKDRLLSHFPNSEVPDYGPIATLRKATMNSNKEMFIVISFKMVEVVKKEYDDDPKAQYGDDIVHAVIIDFMTGEILLDHYVQYEGEMLRNRGRVPVDGVGGTGSNGRHEWMDGWQSVQQFIIDNFDQHTWIMGYNVHEDLQAIRLEHHLIIDLAVIAYKAVFGDDKMEHFVTWTLDDLAKYQPLQLRETNTHHDTLEIAIAIREIIIWAIQKPMSLAFWGRLRKCKWDAKMAPMVEVVASAKERDEVRQALHKQNH
ncbi:hypothetical protein F5Y16DRAFT_303353 [Xylariaceae sp. FL0255]|nr:hypothetical protein F5Y16DRAFT_303353 [Xylariaceae sp. FL0255]